MQVFEYRGTLDLQKTLFCGQCFHWRKVGPDTYCGVIGEYLYTAIQQPDKTVCFYFQNGCREDIIDLFDLKRDYSVLCRRFSKNALLKEAVQAGEGLRLMHIAPWEALCSFILSQNNNITRITGLVHNLCKLYGKHIESDFYAFPTPERLAALTVEDLAPIKAGFRARYLIDAAKKVTSGQVDLASLATHRDAFVRKKLMQIHGVGPKVADCVLLFGFQRIRTVPMDVWMKRVLQAGFGGKWPRCSARAEGIAQQFLFDFARQNPIFFKMGDNSVVKK